MRYQEVTLKRNCEALTIPLADRTTLPAGMRVVITQELGANFTIQAPELGGYYCIAGKDADALGKPLPVAPAAVGTTAPDGPVAEQVIWDKLRTVYDPEIPVNVVDLGLIYDLKVEPVEGGGSRVQVMMTLTAPGCGMSEVIASEAKIRIESVPGVKEARIDIVFEPPWNQSMMSEAAKLELGLV
jgi:probable FeS assembly SUF system protein SufT